MPALRELKEIQVPVISPRHLSFRSCVWLNVLVYLLCTAGFVLRVLQKTQGHFNYCLDDPYIHMALAERIRHGFYGLNAGEAVSPSSSLLWPLLLVPFAGTAVMTFMPLMLNTAFGAGSAFLLGRFVDRFTGDLTTKDELWRPRVLAILLMLATNLLGLAFTGLEHSLEAMLAIAAAFSIVHVLRGERIAWWSIAAAAVLPSVRYEGALLSFAVAATLWAVRARRGAILLMLGSVLPLVGFGLFLRHLHLPFEPISVLAKAAYKFADTSPLPVRIVRLVVETRRYTYQEPERFGVFLLTLAATYLAWRNRARRSARLALAGAALIGWVQVYLGPFGWFFRYEMYCIAFLLPVVLAADFTTPGPVADQQDDMIHPAALSEDVRVKRMGRSLSGSAVHISGALLLAIGTLAMFYLRGQLGIPLAAQGIYQQQVQLSRFTHEFYTGPVAVNDLGLVSFRRSPQSYVLDLYGLGSYEAFQTKEADRTPEWLDRITREHGVGLVMIYPEWFQKGVPATWQPVAKLCATDANTLLGIAGPRVMLYATPLADKQELARQLAAFRGGLARGSKLDLPAGDGTLDKSMACRS